MLYRHVSLIHWNPRFITSAPGRSRPSAISSRWIQPSVPWPGHHEMVAINVVNISVNYFLAVAAAKKQTRTCLKKHGLKWSQYVQRNDGFKSCKFGVGQENWGILMSDLRNISKIRTCFRPLVHLKRSSQLTRFSLKAIFFSSNYPKFLQYWLLGLLMWPMSGCRLGVHHANP